MFDSALLFFWVESARSALVHVYAHKKYTSSFAIKSNGLEKLECLTNRGALALSKYIG